VPIERIKTPSLLQESEYGVRYSVCAGPVIGKWDMLSATPHSTMDWAQIGQRCGPRAFEV